MKELDRQRRQRWTDSDTVQTRFRHGLDTVRTRQRTQDTAQTRFLDRSKSVRHNRSIVFEWSRCSQYTSASLPSICVISLPWDPLTTWRLFFSVQSQHLQFVPERGEFLGTWENSFESFEGTAFITDSRFPFAKLYAQPKTTHSICGRFT